MTWKDFSGHPLSFEVNSGLNFQAVSAQTSMIVNKKKTTRLGCASAHVFAQLDIVLNVFSLSYFQQDFVMHSLFTLYKLYSFLTHAHTDSVIFFEIDLTHIQKNTQNNN
ncbi:hypothetical protein XENOCAPTIV_006393 [Xenoophorus captivus]|uniref:Uncharacterized protein n=1 Tax=Xenoophorus captivus TaxID=1517983 RepID=A0ABV0R0D9_9TELE